MKVLKQVGARNQITLPVRILQALNIHPNVYVELSTKQNKIIISKLTENEEFSEKEWEKLEQLVTAQVKEKKLTEYSDAGAAKKHLKELK